MQIATICEEVVTIWKLDFHDPGGVKIDHLLSKRFSGHTFAGVQFLPSPTHDDNDVKVVLTAYAATSLILLPIPQ
ncbi:hypothetical protein HK104_010236 [Borealophlyctis nickersoniae]|nr:hypothetical protein HK104_010236 [Borealophlyctis nickersoniae]